MKMGGQALHLITSVNSLCIEKETQENTNTITKHKINTTDLFCVLHTHSLKIHIQLQNTNTKHKIKEPKKWGDDSYI